MKAAERSTALEHALVPRAILAWIQAASVFEGELPGVVGSFVSFEKNEAGFTGQVGVGEATYKFEDATLFHLAASVAVTMGLEYEETPAELRDLDIEKLGKTIDLLAKARRAAEELEKKDFCPGCISSKAEHGQSCKTKDLEKASDGPGPAHSPTAPTPPIPPTPIAPTQVKPSATKPPKPPAGRIPITKTLKLTRSESTHKCPSCGQAQFAGDAFVACLCFRDLVRGVSVIKSDETHFTVSLDLRTWDAESIVTLLESVGR